MNKSYTTYLIKIIKEEQGQRIDKLIAKKLPELSRGYIQYLIKNSDVTLNGKIINDCSKKIIADDEIKINYSQKTSYLKPYNLELDIIYEDKHIAIINKPAGLTVHPGKNNQSETLANALLAHYQNNLSDIGGNFRPGIVHRLDKDTSGIILVAKNNEAHMKLSKAFEEKSIRRKYKALVYGNPVPSIGKIEGNITKSLKTPIKMTLSKTHGKTAVTHYRIIEKFAGNRFSLIECELETGRTHQIRVHMQNKKNPILGDQLYSRHMNLNQALFNEKANKAINSLKRQALHSYFISFSHPITHQVMTFESNLPKDITDVILSLSDFKIN